MSEPIELQWEPDARQCGPIEIRMPADPGLVSAIRLAASGLAAAGQCTIAAIDDVKLAVSEVLLALIEHGTGSTLSIEMEVVDSAFAITASTDTRAFDPSHPDLALCKTVLAEVCSDHSIELVGRELQIVANVDLCRNDEH
jgi:anti-sigma regulatory factor (Ser/Thr protein kinase)